MNYYKKAIEKHQIFDFFRGKGEYFDLDRERGIHNSSFTTFQVLGYGTEFGETQLYLRLNNDLLEYINLQDFSLDDLRMIFGIIWVYNLFRNEETLLKFDWNISNVLIKNINDKIVQFENEGLDLSNIYRILNNLKERFNFELF